MYTTSHKTFTSPVPRPAPPTDTPGSTAVIAPPHHDYIPRTFPSECARRAKGALIGADACAAFTSNLDEAEKREMNGQCAEALKGKEHFVATVADALNNAEGHTALPDELERTNEMYACGFEAMKQGLITNEQFASLCLFENTKQHDENATVMSLFHPDGSRNDDAIALLFSTFPSRSKWAYASLTKKEKEQFLNLVNDLPPSDKQFVVYTQQDGNSDLYSALLGLELPFLEERQYSRNRWPPNSIMPSFGMMQALLKVKCPNVRLKPGFGAFVLKTLYENNRAGVREMALPFPYMPSRFGAFGLPSKADGNSLNFAAEFSLHDLFHALIMGHIPRKDILALSEIGWYLNQDGITRQDDESVCVATLGEMILDMELIYYATFPDIEKLQTDIQKMIPRIDARTLKDIDVAILLLLQPTVTIRLKYHVDFLEGFLPQFIAKYLPHIRSICAGYDVKFSGDWRLIDSSS